jgi:hypothetical protein
MRTLTSLLGVLFLTTTLASAPSTPRVVDGNGGLAHLAPVPHVHHDRGTAKGAIYAQL